jgi:isopenicillin-N N-acyltransferase-like protein
MFPVIDLQGAPFERGRGHGERARERVERSLASYARLFAFCGLPWEEARRRGTAYRDVIGTFDASLLEEIEGIARGADRGVDEILALNARTEILPSSYLRGVDRGECTAVAVRPSASLTGGTLLAQNWDWLGGQREALVLLRSADEYLTLTEAGMLAKIGLNAAGFGVCLNILSSLHDGQKRGVPVHVLLRALLGCGSVGEAVELTGRVAFASSSNVLCADRGGEAASLELSPKGRRVVRGAGATLCHTNHFVDAEARAWQSPLAGHLSSEPRLECAERHAASRARHGIEDLKRLLRDESLGPLSICRRPDASLPEEARIESVASVIMELARGVMHVAPDLPALSEYGAVALAREAVAA